MKLKNLWLILLALTIPLLSCSKDKAESSSSSGPSLFESAVLERLPAATSGFVVLNFAGEAYQRYEKTPFGAKSTQVVPAEVSGMLQGEEFEKGRQVLKAIEKSGILSRENNKDLKQAIFFVAAQSGGAVLQVDDAAKKIQAITQALSTEGISAKAEKVEGFEAVVVSDGTTPITIAGDQNIIAASPSRDLVVKVLKKQDVGTSALRSTEAYKKAVSGLTSGDQIIAGYFDVSKAIDSFVPELEKLAASQGEQVKVSSTTNPFLALAFSRTMTTELKDHGQLVIDPKDDQQKNLVSDIEKGSRSNLLSKLPSDAVIAVSLDGSVVQNLIKQAGPMAGAAGISPELLDSVGTLALGVRNAGPTSAFPELFVVVQSSKADALRASLKDSIGKTLASQLQSEPTWQKKALNGGEVEYFLTPLGVGAFIGSLGDSVILASSEGAVQASLSAGADKSSSLQGTLASKVKQLPGSAPGILSVYTDMPKLAVLVESVQGNLAMFTGGKSAVDSTRTAAMRSYGSSAVFVELKDKLLTIDAQHLIGLEAKG